MNCHHIEPGKVEAVATVQIFSEGVSPRTDNVCAWCAQRFRDVAAGAPPGTTIIVKEIQVADLRDIGI